MSNALAQSTQSTIVAPLSTTTNDLLAAVFSTGVHTCTALRPYQADQIIFRPTSKRVVFACLRNVDKIGERPQKAELLALWIVKV